MVSLLQNRGVGTERRIKMKLSEIKELKREFGFTNKDLAEMSAVPLSTVQKIMSGEVRSPRYETLEKLSGALMAVGTQAGWESKTGSSEVHEDDLAYSIDDSFAQHRRKTILKEMEIKKQGDYTIKDYYALPDERRTELIDGVLYDMSAPSDNHQAAILEISYQLNVQRKKYDSECQLRVAPVDVQLDKDDKTMVQPDILMYCDKKKRLQRCIFGAPDFIIEILSKSTRKKDITVKLHKYSEAGVREYWMVDIEDRNNLEVIVYDFEHECTMHIYSFDEKVPVGISDGRFFVNFSQVRDELDFDLPDEPPEGWR